MVNIRGQWRVCLGVCGQTIRDYLTTLCHNHRRWFIFKSDIVKIILVRWWMRLARQICLNLQRWDIWSTFTHWSNLGTARYDRLMKLNLLQLRLNISVRFIWSLFVTRLKQVSMFCLKNGSRCKRDILLLFFLKSRPKNNSYFIFFLIFLFSGTHGKAKIVLSMC